MKMYGNAGFGQFEDLLSDVAGDIISQTTETATDTVKEKTAETIAPVLETTAQQEQTDDVTVKKRSTQQQANVKPRFVDNLSKKEIKYWQAWYNIKTDTLIDGIWGEQTQSRFNEFGKPPGYKSEQERKQTVSTNDNKMGDLLLGAGLAKFLL